MSESTRSILYEPAVMTAMPMVAGRAMTRILLVEDNEDHADLLRRILNMGAPSRFFLSHVTSLDQAMEYLVREEVDIVLLDLELPDACGMVSLERLHQMVRSIPIVILTALADEAAAVKALQKGAQDYLVKGVL